MAGYGVFLTYFTLLVCHYRLLLEQGAGANSAATEAVLRVIHTPWAITDVTSILLGICSVGFALGGFLFGYRSSDPCPGYSAVHNAHEEADEALEDNRDEYRDTVKRGTKARGPKVNERREASERARTGYGDTVRDLNAVVAEYDYKRTGLNDSYLNCISRYRDKVAKIWNPGRVRPAYFAQAPEAFKPEDFLVIDHKASADAQAFSQNLTRYAQDFEAEAEQVHRKLDELQGWAARDRHEFFSHCDAIARGDAPDEPIVSPPPDDDIDEDGSSAAADNVLRFS